MDRLYSSSGISAIEEDVEQEGEGEKEGVDGDAMKGQQRAKVMNSH